MVNKAEVKLKEAHEATKQAIEKDPWLSPEQKKAQKEKAKARLDEGLKALKAADSLEILKVTEEAFVDKEKIQIQFQINIKLELLIKLENKL